MKNLNFLFLAVMALCLASCVSKSDPESFNYISLSASVNNLSVSTKAGDDPLSYPFSHAVPFEDITSDNHLNAKLLFSFDRNSYVHNESHNYFASCAIPCHTTVEYTNSDFHFIKLGSRNLTYTPGENVPVYCVGFYPVSNWTISNDGKTASHEIDGSSDLMFADVISGSWTAPFGAQTYSHLQSWIKILVSANTYDAADKWGKITKITVESEKRIDISLGNKNDGYSTVNYYHDTDNEGKPIYNNITIYNKSNEEGHKLSITTEDLGNVFIVPRPALTGETFMLHLKVYTTIFKEGKDVKVQLYNHLDNRVIENVKQTIGKLFVLNLNFTNIDVIEGVCTLNYWNDQDDDLYLSSNPNTKND